MSNLGFSLDRHFSASDATRRRARGLETIADKAPHISRRWTPAPLAVLALAALAAKFLF
jgi:hypothetical protein